MVMWSLVNLGMNPLILWLIKSVWSCLEGLHVNFLYVLEKRTRLCNDATKKEYLPKIYDPFLSGPYRGTIKKMFSPSIINEISRENSMDSMLIFYEGWNRRELWKKSA